MKKKKFPYKTQELATLTQLTANDKNTKLMT